MEKGKGKNESLDIDIPSDCLICSHEKVDEKECSIYYGRNVTFKMSLIDRKYRFAIRALKIKLEPFKRKFF